MTRRNVLAGLLALGVLGLAAAPSQAVIPGVGVISKKNMEWVFNVEQAVGSDIEFYEMKLGDGTLKRYAITGSMGTGMIITDITNPTLPLVTGVYVNPGVNWQGDVQVNPRRKIAVLALESPGTMTACSGDGIVLVDISNPAMPTTKSNVCSVSAHNVTIINDDYIYVADKHIVQYTNASAPVDKGAFSAFCNIHDIIVDPNKPNRAHFACPGNVYQIWDTTDAAKPVRVADVKVPVMSTAHQADPSPDSSMVAIANEFGGGLTCFQSPCGGLHMYDISGKYVALASEKNPKKMDNWFPPFYRPMDPSQTQAWGNNTAHVGTWQAERMLYSVAWYTVGSWVADFTGPTLATGGLYDEYKGGQVGGPTKWGNTTGNILLEGDEVWSTKWTRFDDPLFDNYLFTNGMTRGMDVLRYTGPMPKKIARLQVNATAAGGAISGKLDRFAVWTYNGNENKPLAGGPKTVTITVGAQSVTATTAADGTFSAQLSLPAGPHSAVVTWAGDNAYQAASVTQAVTV